MGGVFVVEPHKDMKITWRGKPTTFDKLLKENPEFLVTDWLKSLTIEKYSRLGLLVQFAKKNATKYKLKISKSSTSTTAKTKAVASKEKSKAGPKKRSKKSEEPNANESAVGGSTGAKKKASTAGKKRKSSAGESVQNKKAAKKK